MVGCASFLAEANTFLTPVIEPIHDARAQRDGRFAMVENCEPADCSSLNETADSVWSTVSCDVDPASIQLGRQLASWSIRLVFHPCPPVGNRPEDP